MNYNDETGLPELPEGYRWKISRWTAGGFDLDVKLQKKRWWGGYSEATGRLAMANTVSIYRAACQSYDNVFNRPPTRYDEVKKYLGVYPPKKLED